MKPVTSLSPSTFQYCLHYYTRAKSKVQSDSCSICDYCTCTSSCWISKCQKHQCKLETVVIGRGSERMTGEEEMGMMEAVRRKCKGRSSEMNAEKNFMASSGQDVTTTSTRRSLWNSNTTNARGQKITRLKFAPLPTDHNVSCHDVLLSRKPTPCPQRRCGRAQAPKTKKPTKFTARCKVWCKPGRNRNANRIGRKIRNWLHIHKFALRSRVDERMFWLREKLDRLRAPQSCGDGTPRWWRTCRGPIVRERVGTYGYFREFLSDNLEVSEEVERVRDGELFGFEGVCRPWGGFHAETWCR